MDLGKFSLAKAYIIYRYKRALVRKSNTTDESILSLIRNSNKDVMEENSNKNHDYGVDPKGFNRRRGVQRFNWKDYLTGKNIAGS